MAANSSSLLRYPYEIVDESTDYLRIGIVEYTPIGDSSTDTFRGPFATASQSVFRSLTSKPGSRKNSGKKGLGTIILPMPSNIQDNNAVSYSDDKLNALTAAIASGSIGLMEGLGSAAANLSLEQAQQAVMNAVAKGQSTIDATTAMDLLTKKLASSAAGIFGGNVSVNQLLAREDGLILNPNMELLFNGPTLRSFQFQFKMTPRNKKEMEQVKSIIRTLKKNMAPRTDGGNNLFLKTPNVFELRYMQGDDKHRFLHNFKQCFLENISVNYTGEGTYATYDDGTPISMTMNLRFKELEPVYDIDYDDQEGASGVGY